MAEHAKVSRATVSRAFSAPHLLSRETVDRVRASAKLLGYVPNQTARALSTGRAGNIALVVPDITNPFFAALIRGAQARARQEGYATFLGDSDEIPELEDLLLRRLAAQVEGFVLVSSRLSQDQIQAHAARRALVLLNRDLPGVPRLLVDTGPSYAEAVSHLARLGHRTIAYVAGPVLSWSNGQRRQAVVQAARRFGLSLREIPTSRPSFEAGQACAEPLLCSGATAALAFDDGVAQGIMAGLARRGRSVPGEFSIVGCDGVIAAMTYPRLSSVQVGCTDAGDRTVELLVSMLRGTASGEQRIVIPAELVLRETTAPVPDAAIRTRKASAVAAGSCS